MEAHQSLGLNTFQMQCKPILSGASVEKSPGGSILINPFIIWCWAMTFVFIWGVAFCFVFFLLFSFHIFSFLLCAYAQIMKLKCMQVCLFRN